MYFVEKYFLIYVIYTQSRQIIIHLKLQLIITFVHL